MKWALILGASGAIGQKISYDLAKSGWSLYLQGNQHLDQLQKNVADWRCQFPKQDFLIIAADFNQTDCIPKIVESIFSIDALIAAQGITDYRLFSQVPKAKFDQLLNVNLKVPLLLIQQLQEKLAQSQNGRIVLIGSVYGKRGSAMEVIYSTSKGALSAFAQAYAQEVASLGITVNVIAPGAVNTPMLAQFSAANKEQLRAQIPMGRLAEGEDISYWVHALLSPQAQYLTGQTLYITGGWLE